MAEGDPVRITRGSAKRIKAAVERVKKLAGDRTGRRLRTPVPRPGVWLHLLGEGTGGKAGWYSWKVVYPDPVDPAGWVDSVPLIESGAEVFSAREINNRADLAESQPARYFAEYVGDDVEGRPVYYFAAGNESTGQYQHQHSQMVTNNGRGFEPPLAVPALNEVET